MPTRYPLGVQLIRNVSVTAVQYVDSGFQNQIDPPAECPNCRASDALVALGYYLRNLTDQGRKVLRISIRRFRCFNCARTVSILPSFAQPYRIIRNTAIHRFFSGNLLADDLSWLHLLGQYRIRFQRWIPEIDDTLGSHLGRSPPHLAIKEWWSLLTAVLGELSELTQKLATEYQITLFGRYRCHSPSC